MNETLVDSRADRRENGPGGVGSARFALALGALVLAFAAGVAPVAAEENPPAEGFDAAGSDARAIEIADQVMTAMGGRQNWDDTRYLAWNFFGLRTHVWDKWHGDLRFQQGDTLVLMNVNTQQGRAFKGGEEVTDPEQLDQLLTNGYRAWINDSYWLLMPYKLKDSGVTLTYKGEGTIEGGGPAHVLQLTFAAVGVTPQNKYDVYVDKERLLVEQWSFYPTAADDEPRFTTPWAGWTEHGKILLSGDRGERQLSDIMVFDELPESVLVSPDPVDLSAYPEAR